METYQMICTCGQVFTTRAPTREAAVKKMKDAMSEEALISHMEELHPGEEIPSVVEFHAIMAEEVEPSVAG